MAIQQPLPPIPPMPGPNANALQWAAYYSALQAHGQPTFAATPAHNTVTFADWAVVEQVQVDISEEPLYFGDMALTPSPTKRASKKPMPTSYDGKAPLMQDVYTYPGLKLNKNHNASYERANKLVGPEFQWTTLQGMIGIEVEVENIRNGVPIQAFWEAKQDGSLRNNGCEFVSNPLPIKQVQMALEHLYTAINSTNKPDFSNRTSIHIHMNCRDMTQDEIYNLVLLYAIFEKHFYYVAGPKRLNSIFCVPLFRTNELRRAKDLIYGFEASWHKYCGLNLLPLVNNNGQVGYGTVEFRHLYGTNDHTVILKWINDLLCLRKYAMSVKKADLITEIKSMNTTSSYMSLYSSVFEHGQRILSKKIDFEECISNIKRELFGNEYSDTLKRYSESAYWNLANKLGLRG